MALWTPVVVDVGLDAGVGMLLLHIEKGIRKNGGFKMLHFEIYLLN